MSEDERTAHRMIAIYFAETERETRLFAPRATGGVHTAMERWILGDRLSGSTVLQLRAWALGRVLQGRAAGEGREVTREREALERWLVARSPVGS